MATFETKSKANTFDENSLFKFGKKHNGIKIKDVPDDYLEWVLQNCLDIDEGLRQRIKTELMRRTRLGMIVHDKQRLDDKNYQYDSSRVPDGLPF